MADIEKIIDGLNIPKQLIDKSEALLKTLFSASFEELGGMIGDNVRLRRFKNQVNIFTKAQNILSEKNIEPKKVSLKVLAPLLEYSSYEEEEDLQNKWASLTAYILSGKGNTAFHQNTIAILNKLSTDEALLIDKLHKLLEASKEERYKKAIERHKTKSHLFPTHPIIENYQPEDFSFTVSQISKTLNIEKNDLTFSLSSLIALGLLKWETTVDVSAEKREDDPEDKSIDVDVEVFNNDEFIFTPLGYKFVIITKQDTYE